MIYYQLKEYEHLMKLSQWHHETPKLWMPDYIPTNDELLETVIRMKDGYIGVCKDQEIVAFIWAEKQGDDVMIMSLYVEEAYRNKNIATILKKDLEDWCIKEGIKKIKTTVHRRNEKMLALNEKLGYEKTMIHMEKRLD